MSTLLLAFVVGMVASEAVWRVRHARTQEDNRELREVLRARCEEYDPNRPSCRTREFPGCSVSWNH